MSLQPMQDLPSEQRLFGYGSVQIPDDKAQQYVAAVGRYCPGCLPVSKNWLALGLIYKKDANIIGVYEWQAVLRDVIQGIDANCHFCRFITVNLLAPGFLHSEGPQSKNDFACCAMASRDEPPDTTQNRQDTLRDCFERLQNFETRHPGTTLPVRLEPVHSVDIQGVRQFSKVRCTLQCPKSGSVTSEDILMGLNRMFLTIDLEVFANQGEESLVHVRSRPVNTSPASDTGLGWLKSQIHECTTEHTGCPDNLTKPVPTRVVEILSDTQLCLRTNVQDDLYVALSYCWGGQQPFRTTKATEHSKSSGFEVTELPKLLQDAVLLTRELGYRFLWVDSLCIVQDDDADVKKELVRMAEYYSQAQVTICAGGASRCTDGFLDLHKRCSRHPENNVPIDLLRLPVIVSHPDIDVAYVYFRRQKHSMRRLDPLEGRGWTLQERLLSPRVLYFGKEQTLFQCNDRLISDGGNDITEYKMNSFDKFDYGKFKKELADAQHGHFSGAELNSAKALKLWHEAVEEYTHRALTNNDDKLRAIHALATRFSKLLNSPLRAGLWQRSFSTELMWSTWPAVDTVPLEDVSDSMNVPSWSWASVSTPVTFSRLPSERAIPLFEIHAGVEHDTADIPLKDFANIRLKLQGPPVFPISTPYLTNLLRSEYRREQTEWVMTDLYDWSASQVHTKHAKGGNSVPGEGWKAPDNAALFFMFAETDWELMNGEEQPNEVPEGGGNVGVTIRLDGAKFSGLVLTPVDGMSTLVSAEAQRSGLNNEAGLTSAKEQWQLPDKEAEAKLEKAKFEQCRQWRRVAHFSGFEAGSFTRMLIDSNNKPKDRDWIELV